MLGFWIETLRRAIATERSCEPSLVDHTASLAPKDPSLPPENGTLGLQTATMRWESIHLIYLDRILPALVGAVTQRYGMMAQGLLSPPLRGGSGCAVQEKWNVTLVSANGGGQLPCRRVFDLPRRAEFLR
jgi:hypothetical protein